jgi:ribosomal protein L37E
MSTPPQRYMIPGERLVAYLPLVQWIRAGWGARFDQADPLFSGQSKKLHIESTPHNRPSPASMAITDRRVFLITRAIERITTTGQPVPGADWILDYNFALQAVRERRWIQSPGTKSVAGSTAAFYKAALTRRVGPSVLGQGSYYIDLFLDVVRLDASGLKSGPVVVGIPFTKHAAGVVIKTALVPLLSQDMVKTETFGERWVSRSAQSRARKGAKILDFAILFFNTPPGITPDVIVALLKPYAGVMTPHIPELEAMGNDLSFSGPPPPPPPESTTLQSEPPLISQGPISALAGALPPQLARQYCTRCGSPLHDQTQPFCTSCGFKVQSPDKIPSATPAFCIRCGSPLLVGSPRFCTSCGARIEVFSSS